LSLEKEVFLSSRHSEGLNAPKRCPERSEGTKLEKGMGFFGRLRSLRMTEKNVQTLS